MPIATESLLGCVGVVVGIALLVALMGVVAFAAERADH